MFEKYLLDFNLSNWKDCLDQAKYFIDENGFFIAKNILDKDILTSIRKYVSNFIFHLRKKNGMSISTIKEDENFDEGFKELCNKDRKFGGIIYRACRRITPLHQLSCNEKLLKLSSHIIASSYLISSNLKAIRIDHPNENTYLFDLHQDYPYIQDSFNALVYWIPLKTVSLKEGALKIYCGSHKGGLKKVKVRDADNINQNGAHTIELANKYVNEGYEALLIPMEFGNCLVFSTLLLHESTKNVSENCRWTLQVRHGDFNHPEAIARNWPGGMIEGDSFEKYHPEYVTEA